MGILALTADERVLCVALRDGRKISVPLTWYPRLLHASVQQRNNWKLAGGGYGIHGQIWTKTSARKGFFVAPQRHDLKPPPRTPIRRTTCGLAGLC